MLYPFARVINFRLHKRAIELESMQINDAPFAWFGGN